MRSRCFSIRGLRRGSCSVVVRCRRRHRDRPSSPFRSVRRGKPASHPQEDSPFRSIRSAILRGCVPADLKGGAIGSPEPGVPPEKRAGAVPEPIRDGRHAAGRLVEGENAAGLPGPLSGGGRALRAWAGARGRSVVRPRFRMPGPGRAGTRSIGRTSPPSRAGALWTAPEASGALRLERVARKTFTGDLAHLTPHCLSRRIRTLNPRFAARAKIAPAYGVAVRKIFAERAGKAATKPAGNVAASPGRSKACARHARDRARRDGTDDRGCC
jgi:hypothetical protein